MCKFEVGQRVVIAKPIGNPWLRGAEATVKSGIEKFNTEKGYWIAGYHIEVDGYPGKPFVAAESELAPAGSFPRRATRQQRVMEVLNETA